MPSLTCPTCKAQYVDPDYVPALFDMQRATDMIPIAYRTLSKYLSEHKEQFPPLYRHYRERGMWRWVRLLSGHEINQIRSHFLTTNRSRRKGINSIPV